MRNNIFAFTLLLKHNWSLEYALHSSKAKDYVPLAISVVILAVLPHSYGWLFVDIANSYFIIIIFNCNIASVTPDQLAHLLHVREARGSDLGPKTGYHDWRFSYISSAPPGKYSCALNCTTAAFFCFLSSSLFIKYPTIRRCVLWTPDSVVK